MSPRWKAKVAAGRHRGCEGVGTTRRIASRKKQPQTEEDAFLRLINLYVNRTDA